MAAEVWSCRPATNLCLKCSHSAQLTSRPPNKAGSTQTMSHLTLTHRHPDLQVLQGVYHSASSASLQFHPLGLVKESAKVGSVG